MAIDQRALILVPNCRALIGGTDAKLTACDGLREYPKQDHAWYLETQQIFEAEGCRLLGDSRLVGSTRTATDHMRCFMRTLVTEDGTVGVEIYRSDFPWWEKVMVFLTRKSRSVSRIRSCSTYFSDGSGATTSTLKPSQVLDMPPQEGRRFVPAGITAADLLKAHREHVKDWCAAVPGRAAQSFASLEEFFQLEETTQRKIQDYRKEYGGLTVAKITRFSGCSQGDAERIQRDIQSVLRMG